jgi:hypothetical protein
VLSDEQVEQLARWARGLELDERPELRAAARAIVLLAEAVQAARSQLLEERLIREALEERERERDRASLHAESPSLSRVLLTRLRREPRRRGTAVDPPASPEQQ